MLYRIAWYDHPRRRAVCYPVGLHWLAWAVRWIWMWTYRRTRPDAWERACADIRAEVQAEYREKIDKLRWENERLRREASRGAFLRLL